LKRKPIAIAQQLTEAIDKSSFSLVEKVTAAGTGYINFHANFDKFSALTLNSIRKLDQKYGLIRTQNPLRIIVEHTSVNPLHPIHIGQARNPLLGDVLARLLQARGNTIARHYYVDDVGRQSSVIAYGYEKLGKPEPDEKSDHFIGKIYTVTSCLVEINRLKRELQQAKRVSAEEEIKKINTELDEWVSIAAELQSKHTTLFDKLLDKINEDDNPEMVISKLNKAYEQGNPKAKKNVRDVTELCLEGFRQTLGRIGVQYDSWDWESDFVWQSRVTKALHELQASPFTHKVKDISEFDAEKAVKTLDLRAKLGLKEEHEIPTLTLVRSDGTTLYTTRDLAYTLWKFERAKRVINVIGSEQTLAQLQLRIALYALGYTEYGDNLVHYAYSLVSLPGYKMSSRRGRYVTFDEVMDEAVKRSYEEVSKRSPELTEQEKQDIANFVGIGAVRYALIEIDSSKPVMFTWDRVLNFEKNSAPYIQYTHARASSILRKAARQPENPLYELLKERIEREILLTLAALPDTFIEASEYLKPNTIAEYANGLADKFNTFYNAFRVIGAEPPELSDARLALTQSVAIVLRNALNLIGIRAPEKM
jgi:arginyl-tRNA synthetase